MQWRSVFTADRSPHIEMKTINILGCCVARDLFGLFKDSGGFEIKQCITNISPLSVCSPPLSENPICSESNFPNSNHYIQRCTCLDLNKNVFEYLSLFDSDYTLVDLGILFSIYTLKVRMPDDTVTYITYKHGLKQNPDFLENAPFEIIEKFRFPDKKELFFEYIRQYAELIKQHIPQEKMIILELPLTQRYIDDNAKINYFSADGETAEILENSPRCFDTSLICRYLKRAYKVFEKYFPHAHVIKCPNTEVLCNQNHKWGLHPLHYTIEFYQYALDAIRAVTSVSDRKSEKIMLKSLQNAYTEMIRAKYFSVADEYNLKNLSVISSESIDFGKHITICLNGEGGTNSYTYSVLVKRKNETVWKKLGEFKKGSVKYRPVFCGAYEACVKIKDSNNVEIKKFFSFVVR